MRRQRRRSTNEVVFAGTLDYRPNIDAVEWLVDDMWPTVKARVPDAKLVVVGRSPTQAVADAVARAGGELHGDVADIRPFYWGAAVAVSPIRLGSGLRNKQLHAMASRAPLVTTPTALEGVPVKPGEHALVADGAGALPPRSSTRWRTAPRRRRGPKPRSPRSSTSGMTTCTRCSMPGGADRGAARHDDRERDPLHAWPPRATARRSLAAGGGGGRGAGHRSLCCPAGRR